MPLWANRIARNELYSEMNVIGMHIVAMRLWLIVCGMVLCCGVCDGDSAFVGHTSTQTQAV